MSHQNHYISRRGLALYQKGIASGQYKNSQLLYVCTVHFATDNTPVVLPSTSILEVVVSKGAELLFTSPGRGARIARRQMICTAWTTNKGTAMECNMADWVATAIVAFSVLGGIAGGLPAAQIGTGLLERYWPSRKEGSHPLAPIVGLVSFCIGFAVLFLTITGVLVGMAC